MDSAVWSVPMGNKCLLVAQGLPCFPGSLRLVRLLIYLPY